MTILYANAAFATALDSAPTDAVGRSLVELCAGGAESPACRAAVTALRSGHSFETDERVGNRWFELRARPVPEGVVLLRCEVTDRHVLEEELLQAALQCRLVLEQLPTVLWTLDAELRFTSSMGFGLQALGLEPDEVIGLTLQEYVGSDDPDYLTTRMHRRALAGERVRYADPHQGRNYDVTLEPLRDRGGRITGVIGLAHDVTDLHRAADERASLQEQLLLAQKRESLGVLAAGVAHDFNNLLSAIIGSAGLLLRELPPGSTFDAAALIKKAAERASGVTRQMLVYAGKTVPTRRPLDLSWLVRENLPLLAAACSSRVALAVQLTEPLPPVNGDPGHLQQVVMNLLTNASEATAGAGGTVTLATGTCVDQGVASVYLAVSDTGSGLAPEIRASIFDPFFTTKGRGRGLGLSAVHGIVQAHGGRIDVTTAPGVGTTFRVVLPTADPLPASPEPPVAAAPA